MRKQELHPRTAAINQKQKNMSKKARLDALSWLASKFPNANRVMNTVFFIGCPPHYTEEIIDYISEVFKKWNCPSSVGAAS